MPTTTVSPMRIVPAHIGQDKAELEAAKAEALRARTNAEAALDWALRQGLTALGYVDQIDKCNRHIDRLDAHLKAIAADEARDAVLRAGRAA